MKKSILIFVLAALLLPLAAFGQPVLNLEYSNKVLEHAFDEAFFSKDGDYIYGVENGGYLIYKYETATGEYHSTLEVQLGSHIIEDLDMSYDGLRLAAATLHPYNEGQDMQARLLIWNTETDKVIHEKLFPPDSGYYSTWSTSIALSPDGGIAIFNLTQADKPLFKPVTSTYIYDVSEAKVIKILEGFSSAAIKFTHDGRYFATVDFYWGKERISLWDAQSFERIGTIYEIPAEGSSIVRDFEFSLDDKYVWLIHDYGGIGKVINVETLELVYKSKEGERCTSIELLPDNQSYLVSYFDLKLLELRSGDSLIKKYDLSPKVIITNVQDDKWFIYCRHSKSTLFTYNPTSVLEEQNDTFLIHHQDKQLFLKLNEQVTETPILEIINLKGRIIHKERLENFTPGSKIPVTIDLPNGIYIARLIAGNREYSSKIQVGG